MPRRAQFALIDCGEFLAQTVGLSTHEIGALLLLLMAHWSSSDGLPVDEKRLRRIAGFSKHRWSQAWPTLAPFFEQRGGSLVPTCRFTAPLRPPSSVWAQLRAEVFERDSYTCSYCGAVGVPLDCDHVFPVSRGGGHNLGNLTTACATCNRSKSDKTVEEWLQ